MLHIHPTRIHVGFSHSVSFEPYPSTLLIIPLWDALSLRRHFSVPQEGLWENPIFHGAMTVVTRESVKSGDFSCGLSFEVRKKISFLWQGFPSNTEMLFHSWRPGGQSEHIKQLKSSIDHVYIFLGSSKKANVPAGLFTLPKLCPNPKGLHLTWQSFCKPPEGVGSRAHCGVSILTGLDFPGLLPP